jgi:hypothetical protein
MKKISLLTFFFVKTLVLVLAFAPLSASAYALEFVGVSLGRSIQGALVMNVRADGDMKFDAGFNSALSVQNLALAGGDVEVIELNDREPSIMSVLGGSASAISFHTPNSGYCCAHFSFVSATVASASLLKLNT